MRLDGLHDAFRGLAAAIRGTIADLSGRSQLCPEVHERLIWLFGDLGRTYRTLGPA